MNKTEQNPYVVVKRSNLIKALTIMENSVPAASTYKQVHDVIANLLDDINSSDKKFNIVETPNNVQELKKP